VSEERKGGSAAVIGLWMRQLIFIILFATVAEVLLPAGDLRRYVKMVLGLVVIVAMITPAADLWKGADWLESLLFVELDAAVPAGNSAWTKEEDPTAKGVRLAEEALAGVLERWAAEDAGETAIAGETTQAWGAAAQAGTGELVALLLAVDQVEEAGVTRPGERPAITIKAVPGADLEQLTGKVQRIAGAVLGVPPAEIVVHME